MPGIVISRIKFISACNLDICLETSLERGGRGSVQDGFHFKKFLAGVAVCQVGWAAAVDSFCGARGLCWVGYSAVFATGVWATSGGGISEALTFLALKRCGDRLFGHEVQWCYFNPIWEFRDEIDNNCFWSNAGTAFVVILLTWITPWYLRAARPFALYLVLGL